MSSYYNKGDVPSWEALDQDGLDDVIDTSEVSSCITSWATLTGNSMPMPPAITSFSALTPQNPCTNLTQIRQMSLDS